MPQIRDFVFGPWRAIPVLGVTQVLTWGTLFYPPVLTMPLIAADRGWSLAFAMGGFSFGLFVAGLIAPRVGAAVDRHGGHWVMAVGSLVGALGLVVLVAFAHPLAYFAAWTILGVAMAGNLYDPAFASLGCIFGAAARRPITALTFIGGLASTASWPATFFLIEISGWRGTYLIYAALLACIAAPLHAFVLPRTRADAGSTVAKGAAAPATVHPSTGLPFVLVAAGFAVYAFVPSGLSAHLLAIFGRFGLDPATVVLIGALFGPSQVAARLLEFVFAGNVHPLLVSRFALTLLVGAFALAAMFGLSTPVAVAFAVMFGAANGLMTIARGAVPLALFGAAGYGRLIGRIGGPFLVMQSIAPLVLAFVIEHASDAAALTLAAGFTAASLLCMWLVRRPGG
ncbi:MAG: MFS transporter [Rhizobiales bacterium]|nr:MFS transporter [Hyphomicrobiales bacterium]